jgi:hypothetical protein
MISHLSKAGRRRSAYAEEMRISTNAKTVVWPSLRYRNAPAAIQFLVDAFGFEKVTVSASNR